MSDEAKSLLTLLVLIFVSAGLVACVLGWWFSHYMDEDHDQ
jgi:hypothetical protein